MRNYHEAENDWETVQKQYTWLVETLLDCLKNHTSFVEKHPGIVASGDLDAIRGEIEDGLLDATYTLYCSEQLQLLYAMLDERLEPEAEAYLLELIEISEEAIENTQITAPLREARTIYNLEEWEVLIAASGWHKVINTPREDGEWINQNIPEKIPEFISTVTTLFGEDAEFVKITRRVRQQLLNASLGWKVLHQSLNLGSAVFGTGSEVDDKIKSDMRAAHSGAQSSTER